MKTGITLFAIAYFIVLTPKTEAQSTSTDSLTLGLDELLGMVKAYHPVLKQAELQPAFAAAELRGAKGMLDPKINASFNEKNFKDKQYYQKFNAALKVPVWFPVDPKLEVSNNQGQYLNNESTIPEENNYWQVAAGVSLPIGKGLFIDERRAAVKQAKLYGKLAYAEQVKVTNKMLLTVIKDFWEWYFAYQNLNLMNQSVAIANELFDRVLLDYELGEAAVVDTVQALITLQTRQTDYQKAKLDFTQATQTLSVHLWGPQTLPLEIAAHTRPMASQFGLVPSDSAVVLLDNWAQTNHPEILKLNTKKQQLEIEEKWNKESLKPELNLNYSLVDSPLNYDGFNAPKWEDYKLGVDLSIPVYLRKERAKLQKTKLYIESTDLSLLQSTQEISTQIKNTHAQLKTSQILALQYQQMAQNYERLLEAEFLNVETGESDLFKLNIQQDKYLEAQRKSFDANLKFEKLKATLPYVVGLPNLEFEKMYE